MSTITRIDGRNFNELRSLKVTADVFEYASASILYELGKTKVLCAVTVQEGVPPFLRGKKEGWLTAEYAMLPTATQVRSARESVTGKRNGRNVEISRLIGRVLRPIIKLDVIGEKTIVIDCDVLQADGGTRTACITAACIALKMASQRWLQQGIITDHLLTDEIAAISVGISKNNVLLDINFIEDSEGEADFNFVVTKSGQLIEVQGTAEKSPVSWEHFEQARLLALQGISQIFTLTQSMLPLNTMYGISTSQQQISV